MTRRAEAKVAGWLAAGIRLLRRVLGGGARAVEDRLDRLHDEVEAERLRGMRHIYSFDGKLTPESEDLVDRVLAAEAVAHPA